MDAMTASLEANITKAATTGAELTQCQKELFTLQQASSVQLQEAGLRIRQLEQQIAEESSRIAATQASATANTEAIRCVATALCSELRLKASQLTIVLDRPLHHPTVFAFVCFVSYRQL